MAHVIKRILIANRGEIARRIIRTAREMGISTVAIYSASDVDAPFVKEADFAVRLNGNSPAQTYLDTEQVLAACKTSGADALHPGYGFLSENTAFATAIERAGITFIGPSTEAIEQMGDKLSAKRLMEEAGVPTLKAFELTSDVDVSTAAADIGYPVLVKASAGGGGRGMRIVQEEAELGEAIASARREAGAAFGDDTLFLERWLTASRHVEIQVLGDQQGNIVHCFERECSIQRRHQKVIEEAPSPAVTPDIRQRMGDAAVAAAKKIGYYSAGTVEFLLSGDEFFFLEVNTRLQVEHPITEEITGLDLVREQIRVAEGESLGYSQQDLRINGHAIEARIYAENPAKNFLPSPGTVAVWQPSDAGDARYDSGIESGSVIGTQFDPMMAKVIVHAPTRREAATRLARVLESTRVQGLTTNRDFLVAALRTDAFLAGDTTTDFIERVNPDRVRLLPETEQHHGVIAAIASQQITNQQNAPVLRSIPRGWRNSHMPPERVTFNLQKHELSARYHNNRNGELLVSVGEHEYCAEIHTSTADHLDLTINGLRLQFEITRQDDNWFILGPNGEMHLTELPRFTLPGADADGAGMTAPMPGNVLTVNVTGGQSVKKGEVLLILEAMKMEHQIAAPRDGTIAEVRVKTGDQVSNGELMVIMDEGE